MRYLGLAHCVFLYIVIVYLFPSFRVLFVAGGHQNLVGGEFYVHIPGTAIPIHVNVLEGTAISRNEVCDDSQFPIASVERWDAQ